MEARERQSLLDQLAASQSRLLAAISDLTSQQWRFREDPDRWSIAENIEHLIHFESFIAQAISNSLTRPAEPEKQPQAASNQPRVLSLGSPESRRAQLKAREVVRPIGKWSDPSILIEEFRSARARTVAFASEIEADLHCHFFPHIAFGDLDCYQWLLVLSFHTDRHVLQIQQVKTHPKYP
jgi:DinB family protein